MRDRGRGGEGLSEAHSPLPMLNRHMVSVPLRATEECGFFVDRLARQAALLGAAVAFQGVPDSPHKHFIFQMIPYVVERDR
jgi:hypothetical protein